MERLPPEFQGHRAKKRISVALCYTCVLIGELEDTSYVNRHVFLDLPMPENQSSENRESPHTRMRYGEISST